MLKKVIIYLALFAAISFSSDSYLKYCIAQQNKNESPYRLAFASIGANLLESRIDCWATIKTDGSENELGLILVQLLQHLDLPAESDRFLYQEKNDIRTLEYHLILANMQYYFLLQSSLPARNNINILITIVDQGGQKLQGYEAQLRQLYDCSVYYQYKGIIDARPDLAGREELLDVLLTNLQATPKSYFQEGSMITRTGYSKSIPIRPVNVAGDNINLQAVVRVNTENKTEVQLGVPLLLCDY